MSDGIDAYGLPVWPAAERNKEPIRLELSRLFPQGGRLLEIASGTGQHAEHFARSQNSFSIVPSDCDEGHLSSLRRRAELSQLPNLASPVELNVIAPPASLVREYDLVYCANMVHIAPLECSEGLFEVASRCLLPLGALVTYGPYSFDGDFGAESNRAFDASLRSRDPRWGIRDVSELKRMASARGFALTEVVTMPANNHLLVWRLGGEAN